MQLIPRYLVNNRTVIIANEAGFATEYRPVYQKHIQLYRGIDNTLQFKILNADQKPIDLSTYTPKIQIFSEDKRLVIEHECTQVTSDGSTPIKGVCSVVISNNDTLGLKQQYLTYNLHLRDSNQTDVLTYTDTHFGMNGIIYLSSEAYPGPKEPFSVSSFAEQNGGWITESISAEPAINGNEALHTAAIYTNGYAGNLVVQGTLDNQTSNQTAWADITTVTFSGTETEPTPINFNGVFSYLRFKADASPTNTITKILVRN